MAENLYGYTSSEALGKTAHELLVDSNDYTLAEAILQRTAKGESWSGQFPVKNKLGEKFIVMAANTPFRDENGTLIGVICVSSDTRPYQEMKPLATISAPRRIASAKLGLDPQQPLQTAIASKISNLVSTYSLNEYCEISFLDGLFHLDLCYIYNNNPFLIPSYYAVKYLKYPL